MMHETNQKKLAVEECSDVSDAQSHQRSLTLLVLSYDELAERIKIPRRTLERLVSNGGIPHRKVGRAVRFYWPAIEDWLRGDAKARKARL